MLQKPIPVSPSLPLETPYVSTIAVTDATGVITVTMGGTEGTGATEEPVIVLTRRRRLLKIRLPGFASITAGLEKACPG